MLRRLSVWGRRGREILSMEGERRQEKREKDGEVGKNSEGVDGEKVLEVEGKKTLIKEIDPVQKGSGRDRKVCLSR